MPGWPDNACRWPPCNTSLQPHEQRMSGSTIMVGVSGGVDSSVAALLLRRSGRPVAGMFMKNWEDDGRLGECDADRDRLDALKVCAMLDIPFHARNFSAEYW